MLRELSSNGGPRSGGAGHRRGESADVRGGGIRHERAAQEGMLKAETALLITACHAETGRSPVSRPRRPPQRVPGPPSAWARSREQTRLSRWGDCSCPCGPAAPGGAQPAGQALETHTRGHQRPTLGVSGHGLPEAATTP